MKKTAIGILLGIVFTLSVAYLVGCAPPGYLNNAVTPPPKPVEQRSSPFIGDRSEQAGTICLPNYGYVGPVSVAGTSGNYQIIIAYPTGTNNNLSASAQPTDYKLKVMHVSDLPVGDYNLKNCP